MRFTPHSIALRTCRDILLLAAAYAIAGRLSMLLAVPPGYAMAVFPPAGIALGFVLIGGYRVTPGVTLGSFLLNVWIGWETRSALNLHDLFAPAMLGLGASMQAACGAWLVRRFVGYPSALNREWDILAFLLLGGPLPSLVNASIGVATLAQAGIIRQADILANWATWWIGDTLGVLVITPLLLIAFGEPRSIWRSRRFSVGIPLMVSLVIVVTAFVFVRDVEQERLKREFRQEAAGMTRALQTRLNFHSEMVKIMERFFTSSDGVSREDFHVFVSSVLARYPTLQALEWAPRVPRRERDAFEAAAHRDGVPDFHITELSPDGSLQPAAEREEYFPVFFVEPDGAGARVVGFDLGSNPARRRALELARDSGKTVASEPLHLIRSERMSRRTGELLFTAVYARGAALDTIEQRRTAFRGVVLSVVQVGDLIGKVFTPEQLRQVRLRIADIAAQRDGSVLYDTLEPGMAGISLESRLAFGEREFGIIAAPSAEYWERYRSWAAWWMLVGGLLFTSLLGMYLLITSAQAYRVDALVKQRTLELQQSQEKAKENADLLQSVMDSISSCVYVRDISGRYLYVNKEYERIFRRDTQKVIGRTLDEVYPEDVAERYREYERLRRMEVTTERDGQRFTHLLERSPLRNEKGQTFGICGVATDITQNKQTEEEIRQLNRQLQATTSLQNAILNSTNYSIISTDIQGVIQVFNAGAQKMLGYTRTEVVGRHTPELIHDADEVRERAAILSHELGRPVDPGFEVFVARARNGCADEQEWTYIRKDGTRIPVMLSVTALWNEERQLSGFLGVAYDLTERKKVENMKSEFISTVSHELRTPLTAIHGALDLLAAGAVGAIDPDVKALVDIANEDCNRLVRLVNDILDVEKIASGNMRFAMAVQDLTPLAEQAIAATQPYAARYGVGITLHAGEAPHMASVDPDRIIQVLVNLLSNAAKYSREDTTVEVRISSDAQRVRVSVIDQGEGIPDEFHDRIFQKFAQADSSDTRRKGGTGLGLSICKAIVEKHFGYIGFHSTPGAGSEFYFDLPAAAPHPVPAGSPVDAAIQA